MSSDLSTLFPFLSLIIMAALFIGFIAWNKAQSRLPKKPVKHVRPANMEPRPEAPEPAAAQPTRQRPTTEGFQATNLPNFPVYAGVAEELQFATLPNDAVYKEYAERELNVTEDIKSQLSALPTIDPEMPAYGSAIGTFDSDVADIPWDYDNQSYLPKDIMWGIISRQASQSIFMKNYHRTLLSDPSNLVSNDSGILYRSPILMISTDDPTAAMALQSFDGVVAQVGPNLLPSREKFFERVRQTKNAIDLKNGTITPENLASHNDYLAEQANKARLSKIKAGVVLSDAEKLAQSNYEVKSMQKGKAGKVTMYGKVTTKLQRLSVVSKIMAGAKYAKGMVSRLSGMLSRILRGVITKIVAFLGIKAGIAVAINLMATAAQAAAVATFGALAPFAVMLTIVQIAWNIFDAVCTAVMIALMIILPTMYDKIIMDGALCTSGKPIDQIISDPTLYFIVTTFFPIGGVLDALNPYFCFTDSGGIHPKTPVRIPPHYSDATLSIYKHAFEPSKVPRGDSTQYTDPTRNIPPGWTYVAGILREDCCCGTWTSSPVDALCNIASYIPRTYTKASMVPETYPKRSYVPETVPKRTHPLLQVKRPPTWRNPSVMRPRPCAPGLGDDGISCWGCA
jgi:hypothetical protein